MCIDIKSLVIETNYSNKEICKIFKCSPQGGMRRSLKTSTLVIVVNHIKSIYEDWWKDDVLNYIGMGRKGNQTLGSQNKTLAESDTNGVDVHLFEVFKDKEYTYKGKVKLAAKPYEKDGQLDVNGNPRKVWIFPLKIIS